MFAIARVLQHYVTMYFFISSIFSFFLSFFLSIPLPLERALIPHRLFRSLLSPSAVVLVHGQLHHLAAFILEQRQYRRRRVSVFAIDIALFISSLMLWFFFVDVDGGGSIGVVIHQESAAEVFVTEALLKKEEVGWRPGCIRSCRCCG